MRTRLCAVVIAISVALAVVTTATAKGAFLSPGRELTYEGVVYRAPYDEAGVIYAYDAQSKALLWKKRVYEAVSDPIPEADGHLLATFYGNLVQICGLNIDKDRRRLVTVNDNGTIIAVDLTSHEVIPIERRDSGGRTVTTRAVDPDTGRVLIIVRGKLVRRETLDRASGKALIKMIRANWDEETSSKTTEKPG